MTKDRIGVWIVVSMLAAMVCGCHRPDGLASAPAYPVSGPYAGQWPSYGADPWRYGAYPQPQPSQPSGYGWGAPPRPPSGSASPWSTPGMQAAAFAQSAQGRPYCWGGTGPECFDCSGLTYAAWRAAGRTIPRTSAAQREELAPVAMAALQPGDILWRPGHVGIYIGNGWVVHAPRTGETVRLQPVQAYREALRP